MDASRKSPPQVLIVAGESSGDLHGSHLIRAAAKNHPGIGFFGVGGQRMREAGCRLVFASDELSVMGVAEVVLQLPRIVSRFRQLARILRGSQPPQLLVLIDFPDFNLRLAAVAKKHGIPVLYYISPKVWAWRAGRARTLARRVDRLALIFPFEPDIYRPLGVAADYVGNPLLDEFAACPPSGTLRDQLNIAPDTEVIGIFPGSRKSELNTILPTLIATARELHGRRPEAVFLMPLAPSLSRSELEGRLQGESLPLYIVEANIYEVATACAAVLTVSGTVTLQLALVQTPMAVVYRVAPASYTIGRLLIKTPFISLPNIVAGREVVREFIQHDANAQALSVEVTRLLDDADYARQMRDDLGDVTRRLGEPGCSRRVADMVAEMVAETETG